MTNAPPILQTSLPVDPDVEEAARSLLERLAPYQNLIVWGGLILLALLILHAVWQRLQRAVRRRRPPQIHPNLARYNVDHAAEARRRGELARNVIATSTGSRLAGYRVVRQVEAVFVDGHRTPDEAMIALKAAAAERGANALLNVRTERSAAGKCSASGDAVVVAAPAPPMQRRRSDPPAPGNA